MKKNMLAGAVLLLTAIAGFTIPPVEAATLSFDVGRILKLGTYADFGNGDVGIWVEHATSTCEGFWFRTTETNGKEIYAQLLAAQMSQKPMRLYARDDLLWSATASRFCKLSLVIDP